MWEPIPQGIAKAMENYGTNRQIQGQHRLLFQAHFIIGGTALRLRSGAPAFTNQMETGFGDLFMEVAEQADGDGAREWSSCSSKT